MDHASSPRVPAPPPNHVARMKTFPHYSCAGQEPYPRDIRRGTYRSEFEQRSLKYGTWMIGNADWSLHWDALKQIQKIPWVVSLAKGAAELLVKICGSPIQAASAKGLQLLFPTRQI